MKKNKVTIKGIRQSLYDAYLDTEYREALAHAIMTLGYVKDTPFNMYFGTEKQKEEIERVESSLLDSNQISEIIHLMMYELRNDFQYGRFKPIANEYLNISEKMKKETSKNLNGNVENYKPKVNIYSAYGDMRDIISMTSKALKQNNLYEKSREMIERATLSYSYDDAFNIISEYVKMTKEKEHEEEEEFE